MKKALLVAALLASASPANAFIDLGFIDGFEARIREFNDPAQPVDYWYASTTFQIPGSFQANFGGTDYYLTLASSLGLALPTPPVIPPGVPEPSTWLMLILGFLGLAVWKGRGHFHDTHQPI
jgi:hypothetical protein